MSAFTAEFAPASPRPGVSTLRQPRSPPRKRCIGSVASSLAASANVCLPLVIATRAASSLAFAASIDIVPGTGGSIGVADPAADPAALPAAGAASAFAMKIWRSFAAFFVALYERSSAANFAFTSASCVARYRCTSASDSFIAVR